MITLAHHPLAVLDGERLNFTEGSLLTMNIVIAFIMFGVALNLDFKAFKNVFTNIKPFLLGVCSQFVFLPLFTFLLVTIFNPTYTVAMGMMLVASCPGGNVSNFLSYMSKANLSLSVSLTAFATTTCVILTPFNFWLYSSLYVHFMNVPVDVPLVSISFLEMLQTVVLLLGAPITLGIIVGKRFPKFVQKTKRAISNISIVVFIIFIAIAFKNNLAPFLKYIHLIFFIVLAHNALAFLLGFTTGKLGKLKDADVRTITIETGIQNSALGLVLIFNPKLFDGSGGMAFIAALWGIWHIVAGLTIAWFWSRRTPKEVTE
ncbi:MAG: bile acid:sodium symporter family protein [Bacteroidales bacterium]|nr:bile acid:sodium symporter family protein [Bacteroidales bacterium]